MDNDAAKNAGFNPIVMVAAYAGAAVLGLGVAKIIADRQERKFEVKQNKVLTAIRKKMEN